METSRLVSVWRRAIRLGAPATGQQAAGQVMATTDILVTTVLSPAAVVALGISNLYVSLPGWIGGGFITASHSLAAQDTGADADANRDQATTQAGLIAAAVAVPLAVIGVLFGPEILRLVGTDARPARLGGIYLTLVLPVMPLSLLGGAGENALRAIGDTKTPMYLSIVSDGLNAAGSLVFGLGLFGAPQLGIVGIGAATLVSRFTLTLATVGYVQFRSPVSFVWPHDTTVTRQLLRIGAPQSAANALTTVAVFPFNSLVLGFGTTVNAGYQIGWRVYTQVVSPVGRGLAVATGTIVGQSLGEEDSDGTRTAVRGLFALGVVVAALLGGAIVIAAGPVAELIAERQAVATAATAFITLYGAIAVLGIPNNVGQAVLNAGSETRIPLVSRAVGMIGGMVGVSYALVRGLGWGLSGVYTGVVVTYALMLTVTLWGTRSADWRERAASMMAERGSTGD